MGYGRSGPEKSWTMPSLTGWFSLFTQTQWTHFQSWQTGKMLWKIVTNFYSFYEKSCVAMEIFNVIFIWSGSEQKDISKQTDWFYSYHWNDAIFKVDKWGKSHEKLLQTFCSFWEKSYVAMPTFQGNIYPVRLRMERLFKTDWLILFILMQWTHFQSWQMGKKLWKIVTNF